MARDYVTLGGAPHGEDCAQVGQDNYHARALKECRVFRAMMERMFPHETSAYYGVKAFSHDFGSYHELVVYFDDNDESAADYAYRMEGETPEFWDAIALAALAPPIAETLAADLAAGPRSSYDRDNRLV